MTRGIQALRRGARLVAEHLSWAACKADCCRDFDHLRQGRMVPCASSKRSACPSQGPPAHMKPAPADTTKNTRGRCRASSKTLPMQPICCLLQLTKTSAHLHFRAMQGHRIFLCATQNLPGSASIPMSTPALGGRCSRSTVSGCSPLGAHLSWQRQLSEALPILP